MAAFIAIVRSDGDDGYTASFPDFPGCAVAASTLDQVIAKAREALLQHIERLLEANQRIANPTAADAIERGDALLLAAVDVPDDLGIAHVDVAVPALSLARIDSFARRHGLTLGTLLVEAVARWAAQEDAPRERRGATPDGPTLFDFANPLELKVETIAAAIDPIEAAGARAIPKQHVSASLTQRVESILGLLNAAGMCFCIELARLRRVAARSVRPPGGENDGIICLCEHEACLCAARLGSALEHYPRRADISLAEQCTCAPQQPGRFRTALRHCGSWLLRSGHFYSLRPLGDMAIPSARINRALRRFTRHCQFARQCLGLVVLLLQLCRRPLRRLLELRRILARLAQQRYLRLDFAARHREFAGQSGSASALFFERVAMLHRARRQLLSRGGGILQKGGRFVALLSEQLCGIRGPRPQLPIEPIDSAPGVGKLIRQNLCTLLLLQGLSRLRCRRLHGLLELRPRLRSGLIGLGPLVKGNIARQ
jgi:predicted RNase H-like HicB family nuclease